MQYILGRFFNTLLPFPRKKLPRLRNSLFSNKKLLKELNCIISDVLDLCWTGYDLKQFRSQARNPSICHVEERKGKDRMKGVRKIYLYFLIVPFKKFFQMFFYLFIYKAVIKIAFYFRPAYFYLALIFYV